MITQKKLKIIIKKITRVRANNNKNLINLDFYYHLPNRFIILKSVPR